MRAALGYVQRKHKDFFEYFLESTEFKMKVQQLTPKVFKESLIFVNIGQFFFHILFFILRRSNAGVKYGNRQSTKYI